MEQKLRLKREAAERAFEAQAEKDRTLMRLKELRDQRHQYLRFEGLGYTDADITDFEERLGRIYGREIHKVQVFDFEGLTVLMAEGLSGRMLMEHMDAQGQSIFTSRAWRRLFKIRSPFVHELILEFFSTFRFREVVLNLDTARALQFQLGGVRRHMSWREFILGMGLHTAEEIESVGFGAYWAESARQIPDKGDLSAYWVGISSVRNFLGTTPSYTSIRDPMLRLCHTLIACSIAGRSEAPKKVTMTNLFYLRGMDVGLVNIPNLLARYLRLFVSGKKRGAMIFGAPGPERQQVVAVGTPVVVEDALVLDEGALAVLEPIQVPQAPPTAGLAKTMEQRLARLEEDIHGIRGALGEQREVLESMARDFSRFTT
ncbi:hypothetical protein Tco_1034142 [Tanacetum coccineum]